MGDGLDRPECGRALLRILGIVSAFTVGHSVTLSLATMGLLYVPSRPVEALIAVSIFVSAVHALKPIMPGREAWIAGFFGLIHGLAFAGTLTRLGLGQWERVAVIAAFNLGIETVQVLVVLAVLPPLILLSSTKAYTALRVGGAVFAVTASLEWIVERSFNVATPVDALVNGLARYSPWIAGVLIVASVAVKVQRGSTRFMASMPRAVMLGTKK